MEVSTNNSLRLPRTIAAIERGMADGLHIGAQLYVSRDLKPLVELAMGESRPGVAMSGDSMMVWFSSVKPVTAVAIAQLVERGKLGFDDLVVTHIPKFAVGGKQGITIRHLLTHTGGFRFAATGQAMTPWDEIVAQICATHLEAPWAPGEKAGYHPASSWFVLGEIIRRVDGRMPDRYSREEIFLPLGMNDSWMAVSPEDYQRYGDRIGMMQHTGGSRATAPHPLDTPAGAALCRPGSNGRGPMRELGRFYEMLLNGGSLEGARILDEATVKRITSPQRVGMFDETFRHKLDWGLGFMVNSNQYGMETLPYYFGPRAGQDSFGHGGLQSSLAYADRDNRLVVAMVFNGTPGEGLHHRRLHDVLPALHEDLDELMRVV